jgi:hypothetical protein
VVRLDPRIEIRKAINDLRDRSPIAVLPNRIPAYKESYVLTNRGNVKNTPRAPLTIEVRFFQRIGERTNVFERANIKT